MDVGGRLAATGDDQIAPARGATADKNRVEPLAHQRLHRLDALTGTELDTDVSYAGIAKACGLQGVQARTMEELTADDMTGVDCELCHRLLKEDATPVGNAMYAIDDVLGDDGDGPFQVGDLIARAHEGGGFVREVQQPFAVPVPESRPWQINVAFRVPVDAELAWAFHRSGNLEALRAALGAPPPHPQAEELRSHLAALVARSHAYQPRRLELLLPRLQAECAAPLPLPAMKAACTRAQDRWEHRVTELDMLEGLNSELAFQRYPDSFETARHLQRSVTLYVGPPNSGKTHAAFERLSQALDGAYLAPLRLLALEGRDRLVAKGVPCSLLTGEENVPAPDARVVSSTIEMVGTGNRLRRLDGVFLDDLRRERRNSRLLNARRLSRYGPGDFGRAGRRSRCGDRRWRERHGLGSDRCFGGRRHGQAGHQVFRGFLALSVVIPPSDNDAQQTQGRDHAGHRRAALEQRSELVERAALLERSSELQVLELQEDSGADDLR